MKKYFHQIIERDRSILAVLFLLFFLAFAAAPGYAACDAASKPIIQAERTRFIIVEGVPFSYDFNVTNMNESLVSYNYLLLQGSITGPRLDSQGILSLNPGREDAGESTAAILAYSGACIDTLVINLSILSRPHIYSFSPDAYFGRKQTEDINFSVKARSENPTLQLNYAWYFNNTRINTTNAPEYTLKANRKREGLFNMSVVVSDSYGINTTFSWEFLLIEVNKPPVLAYELPGVIIFKNVVAGAYNINDYFFDPEKARLKFEYKQIKPEHANYTYASVSVNLSDNGYVTYYPESNSVGVAYFVFTARDVFGAARESNIVRVDVLASQGLIKRNSTQITEFCGDLYCNAEENCTNCPSDCGVCNKGDLFGCFPEWNCTSWSSCMPWEIQLRSCVDLKYCMDNRTMPVVARHCNYNATCEDGLKNGIETGVDCGGPCMPCPTCNDSLQNQGEDGIDCGGPCTNCPSCFNNLLDQNESDVDCGGECAGCPGNKSCRLNRDCESLLCKFLVCEQASCFDRIRNQGELGIDCEGPCVAVCSTCKDGVQNGNEAGVDCGGKCRPCPSCQDSIKNQGELLKDCGGGCRACTALDFFRQFYIIIFIIAILILVLFIDSIALLLYLLSHPERAQRLYESNTFFVTMSWMHHFFSGFRRFFGVKPFLNPEDYTEYRYLIAQATRKPQLDKRELHDSINTVLTQMFQLPEGFDEQMLVRRVRSLKIQPFMKILIIGFYRKSIILLSSRFIPEEGISSIASEIKFLLSELSKA